LIPSITRSRDHRSASIAADDDRATQACGERPTGRKAALRAVEAFFEDANHIYLPVPGGDDFGKDAYLDIVVDGEVTGDMVALQIKQV